jgi:TRAP-type C4-dicarboxylate transport system permease small subunit
MMRPGFEGCIKVLHIAEDLVLMLLLSGMIGLSFTQILLRNLFETGLPWADPLLRLLVLWLGLAGALAATRENRHIRIDVLSRLAPPPVRPWLDRLSSIFTALVCALLAWHGARLVWFEYQDGTSVASGIPAWAAELVIPLGFGLMALRFALLGIHPESPRRSFGQRPESGRDDETKS